MIKVENPQGDRARPFPPDAANDPEQSGLSLGLNTNKSGVVDLDTDEGRAQLHDLVVEAGTRTHSGLLWLTTNAPNGVIRRSPLLGEHTDEILATL